MNSTFSPKQVARAIGASESSLKRWCDGGLIETTLTAGGHRRISAASVVKFLRKNNRPMVRPELLGLPATSGTSQRMIDRAALQFQAGLVAGDEQACRQILFDLYLSKYELSKVGDEVIAMAFRGIGDLWTRGEVQIYEERLACEICLKLTHELQSLLPNSGLANEPPKGRLALGATPVGDPYLLPNRLVHLVLQSAGWNAISLGNGLPFETIEKAMQVHKPRLFWLSVSAIENQAEFLEQYQTFRQSIDPNVAMVVGGQGFSESVRKQMTHSVFCDNLQQLQSYANSLDVPSQSVASS